MHGLAHGLMPIGHIALNVVRVSKNQNKTKEILKFNNGHANAQNVCVCVCVCVVSVCFCMCENVHVAVCVCVRVSV